MTDIPSLAELHGHQRLALDILARGTDCVARGPDAVKAEAPALRAEMGAILSAYQTFKHERIFDPAIRSGDHGNAAMGRAMKVECIAAGETFRHHLQTWRGQDIRAVWDSYVPAVRLTVNQLRRHIDREADGIAMLLTALEVPAKAA